MGHCGQKCGKKKSGVKRCKKGCCKSRKGGYEKVRCYSKVRCWGNKKACKYGKRNGCYDSCGYGYGGCGYGGGRGYGGCSSYGSCGSYGGCYSGCGGYGGGCFSDCSDFGGGCKFGGGFGKCY